MNRPARQSHPPARRPKGEPAAVAEAPRPDAFLKRMRAIRDHRLRKAESELVLGRQRCAASRQAMREAREAVFRARDEAESFWRQAVADFEAMAINAKQFVARKCRHQTLKLEAAALRNRARAAVDEARRLRQELRLTQRALQEQQLQVEKLRLLREIKQAEEEAAAVV